jgi:hypothetical protein
MASLLRRRPIIVGATMSASGLTGTSSIASTTSSANSMRARRALHDERRSNEENGFYGR